MTNHIIVTCKIIQLSHDKSSHGKSYNSNMTKHYKYSDFVLMKSFASFYAGQSQPSNQITLKTFSIIKNCYR